VVRMSWPLALLLVVVIALVARRPRLIVPVLIVFALWTLWQMATSRRRRR
jgi:hypothetical protein